MVIIERKVLGFEQNNYDPDSYFNMYRKKLIVGKIILKVQILGINKYL